MAPQGSNQRRREDDVADQPQPDQKNSQN
jgi:hypothetical protein